MYLTLSRQEKRRQTQKKKKKKETVAAAPSQPTAKRLRTENTGGRQVGQIQPGTGDRGTGCVGTEQTTERATICKVPQRRRGEAKRQETKLGFWQVLVASRGQMQWISWVGGGQKEEEIRSRTR